jgi:hypothetical protein
MLKGESGIHPYVIIKGQFGGEMRTMYRFDMSILDWTWTDERIASNAPMNFSRPFPKRQHGRRNVAAARRLGLFEIRLCGLLFRVADVGPFRPRLRRVLHARQHRAYAGGPLRQELAVHQDALILNYLGGGHFSGGGSAGGRTGEKIHGPWYLYINAGDTDAIIADAKKTAEAEQKKWPYQWVDEPLYPIKRTSVTGQLKISHDRSAASAYIILGQPGNPAGRRGGGRGRGGRAAPDAAPPAGPLPVPWAGDRRRSFRQAADPAPTAPTDARVGSRTRARRRPQRRGGGSRQCALHPGGRLHFLCEGRRGWEIHAALMFAPALTRFTHGKRKGPITQSFARDGDRRQRRQTRFGRRRLGPALSSQFVVANRQGRPHGGRIQIRRPAPHQPVDAASARRPHLHHRPEQGATDWYYAQKTGTWTVKFNLDKTYSGNGYLTIAIAGGGGSVTASLNGTEVGQPLLRRRRQRPPRDQSQRPLRPQRIHLSRLPPEARRKHLTLRANGGGLMYDTIVMESD